MRRIFDLQNENGVTLIELMVASLLFSVVLVFGVKFLIVQQRTTVRQNDAAEAQQQVRVAMDMMIRELSLLGAGVPVDDPKWLEASQQEISFWANLTSAGATLSEPAYPGENILSVVYLTNSDQFDQGKSVSICSVDTCERHSLARDGRRSSLELSGTVQEFLPIGSMIQVINPVHYALRPMEPGRFKLLRTVDGGSNALAEGLSSIAFTYFDREGELVTDLKEIHRVKIDLTVSLSHSPNHERTLSSEIWLRNG